MLYYLVSCFCARHVLQSLIEPLLDRAGMLTGISLVVRAQSHQSHTEAQVTSQTKIKQSQVHYMQVEIVKLMLIHLIFLVFFGIFGLAVRHLSCSYYLLFSAVFADSSSASIPFQTSSIP